MDKNVRITRCRQQASIASLLAIITLLLGACQQSTPAPSVVSPTVSAMATVATQAPSSVPVIPTFTPKPTPLKGNELNEIPPIIVESAQTTDVPPTTAPTTSASATSVPATAPPSPVNTPPPQNVVAGTVGQAVRLVLGRYTDHAPTGQITTAITIKWNNAGSGGNGKDNGKSNDKGNSTGTLIVTYAENQVQQNSVLTIEGNRLSEAQGGERKDSEGLDKTLVYRIGGAYYSVRQSAAAKKMTCTMLSPDQATRALTSMRPDAILGLFGDANGIRGVIQKTSVVGNMTVESIVFNRGIANNNANHGKSNETPILLEGTGLVAHRHFLDGEPAVTPPVAGNNITYLQHLEAVYEGTPKILNVTGRITVEYDFALPESGLDITLPAACQNPTNS